MVWINNCNRTLCPPISSVIILLINPFAPGDFAEKCVLKLVEWLDFGGKSF